jgi:hypothetical protein
MMTEQAPQVLMAPAFGEVSPILSQRMQQRRAAR